METRHCLDCGGEVSGRADKKFCSDVCRNSFNNRRNGDNNNLMRNVNNILRRNRRILADLSPTGKATYLRNRIVELGFNFNYHTNIYTTRKGATYYFCYEYGILSHNNDFITIVHRKSDDNSGKESKRE
ncbi:MAG: DUF2116 family Zn-ribbon domain-containing protein [Bacteroidetes bacterium]|nr:DUF2116 family Zn-ribbon domain-containing protein [Bacteroidota bacterium]